MLDKSPPHGHHGATVSPADADSEACAFMTESEFVPGPDTLRAYRDALGSFGTGVTVVTTMTESGPLAITANSFASVSLDPPLVLWCAAKSSARHAAFAAAEHYVIHVMSEDQQDLARHFARAGDEFDTVDWLNSTHGQPLLSGCLARFECTCVAVHDAGDHSIVVGRVNRAAHRKGAGLMFKSGQYGGFAGLD